MIAESEDGLRTGRDACPLRHTFNVQTRYSTARLSLEKQADGWLPDVVSVAGVRLVVQVSDGGVGRNCASAVCARRHAAVNPLSAADQTHRLNATEANFEAHHLREHEATATAAISTALTRLEHCKRLSKHLRTEIGHMISATTNSLTTIRSGHRTSKCYFQAHNTMTQDLLIAKSDLPAPVI